MNRRSFFKLITGFVAGAVGVSAKAEPDKKGLSANGICNEALEKIKVCKGEGGTLCPRCKFNCCDDTKAIQAAIDALGVDGGTVHFAKGIYNIKSVIKV